MLRQASETNYKKKKHSYEQAFGRGSFSYTVWILIFKFSWILWGLCIHETFASAPGIIMYMPRKYEPSKLSYLLKPRNFNPSKITTTHGVITRTQGTWQITAKEKCYIDS